MMLLIKLDVRNYYSLHMCVLWCSVHDTTLLQLITIVVSDNHIMVNVLMQSVVKFCSSR